MNRLIEIPNKQVLDEYLLTMSTICYTFSDPFGVSQHSSILRNKINEESNFAVIN